ncbi:MAG: hypothetical protein ACHQYQ_02875 [Bacteriovoracales bacterium]
MSVDEALEKAKKFDSDADVCLKYYYGNGGSRCIKHADIGEFDIVYDPADGAHRVVLKRGVEILGIVTWQYFGVDFSEKDHEKWADLSDYDKLEFLIEKIEDGFQKYGYLGYEPADHDFFYEDEYGRETIFSENVAAVKDVEIMGTKVEDQNAIALGEKLSTQYGLSNDRGQAVAKTIAAYNKLASKRSLTSVEKDQFSNNLLGVDYKTAEKGLKGGDAKEFESLMESAAKTNGTTPEAVSAIVRDMVL